MGDELNFNDASCPVPKSRYDRVMLAHGGGGRMMNDLIEDMLRPALGSQTHDGAILEMPEGKLAFTTDSFVVDPMFFPGGSIGDLAVNGTVNDLAVCGAKPLHLSLGLILEEGVLMDELRKVVQDIATAAKAAGVSIVTGDTKVVDRGHGHGIFVNTAGIGVIEDGVTIGSERVMDGDVVIVSGDLGSHGMAIMSVREGLEFETTIETDCAPLWELVQAAMSAGDVHCMRDLTRGGLASSLNEIATEAGVGIEVDESTVPVIPEVRGACEILGFDPLYVANEGRLVAFVSPEEADAVLSAMKDAPFGEGAAIVGNVVADHPKRVVVNSQIGGKHILDMLSGEQLPRIC